MEYLFTWKLGKMRTNCKKCCFLMQDEKGVGCAANQYCVIVDQDIYTPGHCRLQRSKIWKDKEPKHLELSTLVAVAKHEKKLKFDLIIVYDECLHDRDNLMKTINCDWGKNKCQQIIVLDITGGRTSNEHSLECFREYDGDIPLKVDCSINAENPVRALRRIEKQCSSEYFLVLPAGKILTNIDVLARRIDSCEEKCVLWNFIQQIGSTKLYLKGNQIFGLYDLKMFRFLTNRCKEECVADDQPCKCKPFASDLQELELKMKSSISLCNQTCDCVIK